MQQTRIRNFSIIAHIDHGKSTLADRFIQLCHGLEEREMQEQVLDNNPIERERGITIKSQAITLHFTARDGIEYQLNLIDTPGHVDFSYEVSRSLASCEGALLIVDASQGVEAQTVANCYTAVDQDLEVITVLNKVDLPNADCERVIAEIEDIIGIEARDALRISAKTGEGVTEVLESLVEKVPPPEGSAEAPVQALIIDSWFDNYLGVISLVRVVNGRLFKGQRIRVMATGRDHEISMLGRNTPKRNELEALETGEVGFVVAGIKDIDGAPVGDTLTDARRPCGKRLPGFREIQPRVFAGIFPMSSDDFEELRDALAKLRLNDAALSYEPESSAALGFGFRCGFLGMLHMEIVQERLEREYNLDLITTAPSVVYECALHDGSTKRVQNPAELPDSGQIMELREPIITARILMPERCIGAVMQLCMEKRAGEPELHYHGSQVQMVVDMPLAEVVLDFFDRLKSVSRGYASFEYDFKHFAPAELVRLDVLVNGDRVDALSSICHRDMAYERGRGLCERMQELIPAPDVRRRHPGGHRLAHSRAHHRQGAAQERHCQVLRRRCVAQAQASGKAEGRQEAHEAGGQRRDPAIGLSRHPQRRSEITPWKPF